MDINIIKYLFIFNIVILGGLGLLDLCKNFYWSVILGRKDSDGRLRTITPQHMRESFEVPKRWFERFYIAGPILTITLCLLRYKYYSNSGAPRIIYILLNTLLGESRKPLVPAENVFLALIVLNIHVWRKCTKFGVLRINKIITSHHATEFVLIKFTHYAGLIASIIGESEGLIIGSRMTNLSWDRLIPIPLICAYIFMSISSMQMDISFIPTIVHKNRHGVDTSYIYTMPVDGLYKYISNPLEFTEILLYLMLSVILWQASTFHYITIWVIISQVDRAVLSHRWYKKIFKDYPRERKILIPYIW